MAVADTDTAAALEKPKQLKILLVEDNLVCQTLQHLSCPIIVAMNKIDLVPDKDKLLEFMQFVNQHLPSAQIIPLSVRKRIQIEAIEQLAKNYLPESPFYFPEHRCP